MAKTAQISKEKRQPIITLRHEGHSIWNISITLKKVSSSAIAVVRQVLTRHHQQQRRLWAQTLRCWTRQDWQEVIFTDELRFCLTRGADRIRIYHEGMSVKGSGLGRCVTASSDWDCCHYRQSQSCASQGRHPPPSCGTLPAGSFWHDPPAWQCHQQYSAIL